MFADNLSTFFMKIFVKILIFHLGQIETSELSFETLLKDCGLSYSDRIVGGKNAILGQYPWLARLGYNRKSKIHFECGGALITHNYVVTAAHCLTKLEPGVKLVRVVLGEHNSETENDCEVDVCADPPQIFEPAKIITHESYDSPVRQNDIGLIKLNRDAKFTAWVLPLCLPQNETLQKSFVNEMADVAGWGLMDDDDEDGSNILQTVKLPIHPLADCKEVFGDIIKIGEGQLCVGGDKGKDSCSGDSGGPLMKPLSTSKGPRYFLLGVVSFGSKSCGDSDTPALYTNTNYFMTWMVKTVKSN